MSRSEKATYLSLLFEFIEIWHISYTEYPDLDFDLKNCFLSNIYPNWSQNEFIEIL